MKEEFVCPKCNLKLVENEPNLLFCPDKTCELGQLDEPLVDLSSLDFCIVCENPADLVSKYGNPMCKECFVAIND